MMGLAEIRQANRKAANVARNHRYQPTTLTVEEIAAAKRGDETAIRRMPFIGDYLPDGWQRVSLTALGEEDGNRGILLDDNEGFGSYFVDGSGFGLPSEPALTRAEFVYKLHPNYGYAVTEVDQFQVKIGVFLKKEMENRHA